MSFPFLILIGLPIFLSPVLTHEIFTRSFHWQKAQIALDNAAIQLGQNDRTLFNAVITSNKFIKGLEIPHHLVHACARSGNPYIAAICAPKDVYFEQQIRFLHLSALKAAVVLWNKGTVQTTASVLAIDKLGVVNRNLSVPLKSVRCPVCWLDPEWEVNEKPVRTRLAVINPKDLFSEVKMTGDTLRTGSRWDYRLDLGEPQ